MPDFAYIARDRSGSKVTGSVAAGNEREAAVLLAGKSLFPLKVTPKKPAVQLFGGRVSGQIMAVTYRQLSSLLRSGVPMLRSLQVIRDQSSNVRLKAVLTQVHAGVEEGVSLGESLAQHPRVFSEMAINMVRAGGEGGFLEDALDRVASFTEESEDLKSRTIGALAYPVILSTVGSIVVFVLLVFFVPMFAEMFDRLREMGELPMMTDWLLGFSNLLGGWWWVMALLALVGGFFLRNYVATPAGRRWKDAVLLKLPLLGSIFQNLAVARFCRVLGTLLHNGVPILKSLEISGDAAGNRILSEAIEKATENITSGETLAAPLAASKRFPQTVVEMIAVAEESNTLDRVLIEAADSLERRTSRRLDLIVRMLEPVMLLLLAGIVLFVVVALLLPVIKMSRAL
ncbi:type II secretion system F family protein [Lignipirellula cremea]|uniref:Type II secretion system protein F n=1 Tax=Lignipirellula cremea TaxID=2528010 RepID=A0A518DNE3_9BACT|nr:type II secretion system F family protein [Lignipirellula cremea]QDU93333.1 Putative type II secretion system protein F [Lignipirellula cremea]